MMRQLVMILVIMSAGPAWAADLLLYDGFNYNTGDLLVQNTDKTSDPHPGEHNTAYNLDWRYAGASTANTNAPGIGTGSLSVTGLPASTGNSVTFDTTQVGAARIAIPTAPTSGTVYWSGIVRVSDIGTLSSSTVAGALLGGFTNTAGAGGNITAGGAILLVKKASSDAGNTDYLLGTGVTTNNADRVFDTTPRAQGASIFVVASYDLVSSAAHDDIAKMWISPDPSTFGASEASVPTQTLISQTSTGTDPITTASGFASYFLRNINSVGTFGFQFDELRIGTTWASVTTASAAGGVPGDYNGNGVVDMADYVLWRNGGPLANEVDNPGTVNQADYDAWRARFGNTSGSGAGVVSGASVPEPTAVLLATLAGGVMLCGTGRNRGRLQDVV